MVGVRNACEILVEKSEEKRPLGRFRRRREVDIGLDLREIGLKAVD
jgi:hypothetical protein